MVAIFFSIPTQKFRYLFVTVLYEFQQKKLCKTHRFGVSYTA